MPMYYFNLNDDDTVMDTDGTDLPDAGAARIHATGVARELTSNGGASWGKVGRAGPCQCATSMAPNCFHSPCRTSGMGTQEVKRIGRRRAVRPSASNNSGTVAARTKKYSWDGEVEALGACTQ
jgi:hypothetical protein